jgi:hypothetical protein
MGAMVSLARKGQLVKEGRRARPDPEAKLVLSARLDRKEHPVFKATVAKVVRSALRAK